MKKIERKELVKVKGGETRHPWSDWYLEFSINFCWDTGGDWDYYANGNLGGCVY